MVVSTTVYQAPPSALASLGERVSLRLAGVLVVLGALMYAACHPELLFVLYGDPDEIEG